MNKLKRITAMATVVLTAILFLTGCCYLVEKFVKEMNPFLGH